MPPLRQRKYLKNIIRINKGYFLCIQTRDGIFVPGFYHYGVEAFLRRVKVKFVIKFFIKLTFCGMFISLVAQRNEPKKGA